MGERRKRTGIYLETAQVLANPEYVPLLMDRIGLNLAIVSFSGAVPPEVVRHSPFDGVPLSDPCLHSVVARHMDSGPVDAREFDLVRAEVGPSVRQGDDDAFRRALGQLKANGVEVWICAGSWSHRRLMFCPSNEGVQDWYEAFYAHLATGYGADGIDLTHARYPMGSFPLGLFACTCPHCATSAGRRGYDMARMVQSLREAQVRLQGVDGRLLAAASTQGLGSFDFSQLLGLDPGVADWFRFRCDPGPGVLRLLAAAGAGPGRGGLVPVPLRPARREAGALPRAGEGGGRGPVRLRHGHPPGVGHNHAAWGTFSDFASPLVSHISVFVCDTLMVWARFLRELQPALSEAEALQAVYRFVGYDEVGLPASIAGYELDHPERLAHVLPLEDLILCDLIKARLWLSPELPSYPIIHGTG